MAADVVGGLSLVGSPLHDPLAPYRLDGVLRIFAFDFLKIYPNACSSGCREVTGVLRAGAKYW